MPTAKIIPRMPIKEPRITITPSFSNKPKPITKIPRLGMLLVSGIGKETNIERQIQKTPTIFSICLEATHCSRARNIQRIFRKYVIKTKMILASFWRFIDCSPSQLGSFGEGKPSTICNETMNIGMANNKVTPGKAGKGKAVGAENKIKKTAKPPPFK